MDNAPHRRQMGLLGLTDLWENLRFGKYNTCISLGLFLRDRLVLLPTGSKERGVLGVGSIPAAILPSCQYMQILHYNCTDMNLVG